MSTDVDFYAIVWCPGFDINYADSQGVELVAGPFESSDAAESALGYVSLENVRAYVADDMTVIRYEEDE